MGKWTPPNPTSNRTYDRAWALAEGRGCVPDNPCWPECFDVARDQVIEGDLDEQARTMIHDGIKAMHGS